MPESCTCGASLPPDALFCHKCGKPQREIVVEAPAAEFSGEAAAAAQVYATPPALPRYATPVTFRNPTALRTALFVGVAGGLISDIVPLLAWLAAGFFAVFFYRRKTRDRLNVAAGMRLGWLTGIIMFTMWGIVFAAMGMSGALTAQFEQRLKTMPFYSNDPAYLQLAHAMTSGPGLLLPLAFGFVVIVCLSVAGGAIGAKSVGRE
jgi:hypothetical protein